MKIFPIILASIGSLVSGVFAVHGQNCLTMQCPTNMVVECQSPAGTLVEFSVSVTNRCMTDAILECTPPSGSLFSPGVTTVSCLATNDAGDSAECRFTVTVRDTTLPEIVCPRMIRTQCEGPAGAIIRFNVTANDLCDTNVLVECVPPSGSLFPPGTNIVTCTATDDEGNISHCTFPVVIEGNCIPDPCLSIDCPPDIIVKCDRPGGAVVDFMVSATNRCDRELTVTCDPPSGSLFPVGLTTVLCVAQGRTNAVRCSFVVEVQDVSPPLIACPDDMVVGAQGVDGAIVHWAATATDDCDTNVLVVCDPPPGSFFALGTTTVRCIATDDSGNVSLCGFRVTVREELPLSIALRSPSNAVVRWYVPGELEVASTLSPPDWRPADGNVTTNRDARSLIVPVDPGKASGLFYRLVAQPLAPPPDEDGDGVPDGSDRCPGTPPGTAVDGRGCSLVQLVTRPEQTAGRSLEMMDELRDYWREYPELVNVRSQLEQNIDDIHLALRWIRQGTLTATRNSLGLERFSRAVAGLRAIHVDLLGLIESRKRELLINPPDLGGYGDSTPQDLAIKALALQATLLQGTLAEAETTEDALLELTRSRTGETTMRGRIAQINDAQRWVQFEDGRRIGLAENEIEGLLTVGAEVEFEVQTFADGSALATSMEISTINVSAKHFPEIRCLFLRIAPVQPLPPYFPTTPVLHHPDAYNHDDTLFLERGMRLAAINGNCPATFVPPGTLVTTRMKLDIYYRPEGVGSSYQTVTLATSLGVNSEPVPLPLDIGTSAAVLTVTLFRQECPSIGLPGSCSDPVEISVDTYTLHVRQRYNYADANYQSTVFILEDSPLEEGYRVTEVTDVTVKSVPIDSEDVTFQAQGFTVVGDDVDFDYVSLEEPFAVYEWDLFDDPTIWFKEQTLGVTNRSALYWPRISGHHNGRPFRYACALPPLTRDAVAFCGGSPDTFFRLPFSGGWPFWTLSQGNFGSFSHTGASSYAYDMGAPGGTQIRAARGGIVVGVEESFSESSYDPVLEMCTNFDANFVTIRHQDGTIGLYAHMPQNGVQVTMGQKIRRGDVIGTVGTTGCSSGNHLHFEARNAAGNNSIPSRFERWNSCFNPMASIFFPCPPFIECIVPDVGDIMFSTQ